VVKTSSRYFPTCFAHDETTSTHSSFDVSGIEGGFGEDDFLCWSLVGVGARYCLRGEAETNIVLLAVLRLREVDCEGRDAAGLDERPLLGLNGDGLSLGTSSQAPSSELVDS